MRPMRPKIRLAVTFCIAFGLSACTGSESSNEDALPSWNAGSSRGAIEDFVARVTTPGSTDFVPESARIAVFDNDGTLWSEQPLYVQLAFMMDRVHAMAAEHPEWADKQPFKGLLEGDMEAAAKAGKAGLMEVLMATHADMTTAEFDDIAGQWLATARHPQLDRPYTELVYQPMLEILDYLRAHGFKTYIVSGGGIDFMRPWAEAVYGIPPQQVIGSSISLALEYRDGVPVLMRQAEIDFIDDKEGKPIAIHKFIGQRPIAAFGNSDGDLQMLQWTDAGPGPSLQVLVHHTDAERESAYDRDSHIGRLDIALDEAQEKNWVVVDMKNDWNTIFSAPGT